MLEFGGAGRFGRRTVLPRFDHRLAIDEQAAAVVAGDMEGPAAGLGDVHRAGPAHAETIARHRGIGLFAVLPGKVDGGIDT